VCDLSNLLCGAALVCILRNGGPEIGAVMNAGCCGPGRGWRAGPQFRAGTKTSEMFSPE